MQFLPRGIPPRDIPPQGLPIGQPNTSLLNDCQTSERDLEDIKTKPMTIRLLTLTLDLIAFGMNRRDTP